jgi:hypothetical protein
MEEPLAVPDNLPSGKAGPLTLRKVLPHYKRGIPRHADGLDRLLPSDRHSVNYLPRAP